MVRRHGRITGQTCRWWCFPAANRDTPAPPSPLLRDAEGRYG